MVETQQSVANKGVSTFLSFGAKNVQPDILEKMLVGRQKTVNLLEQYGREIAQNGVNHQVFIVGPRGAGKTHLLRVLYHRINDLVQTRAIVVAYFAEEEYGISGYLDFLIRIINAFMRWYDADRATLETQLDILRETPGSQQEYVAETIIGDYVGDKPLLILSENFDTILEALGKQGQAQLRSWLYRHDRISIIATAQAISSDLGREDRPFYGFFSTISLKKLTYDESLELLRSLAQIEQNEDKRAEMIAHLDGPGKAQVRAIHELVKGNHRLLVTFYEFLKADTLADLSVIFMKTMNDLKPYYETFIRFLPAQQQKILHYLALAKTPQKGTNIGKNCFVATASLTKQLSELQRRHLIDVLPDLTDKRNKLYDVAEPLLRIAIEIGEQREGITSLFIDFLARCYSPNEIEDQKTRFKNLYVSEIDPIKKQKYYWDFEAREQALKKQIMLGIGQQADISAKVLEQIVLGNNYEDQSNYDQAVEAYEKAIHLVPNDEAIWTHLGAIYCDHQGKYPQAVEAFQKAIQIRPDYEVAWYNLGVVYAKQGDYEQAILAYQKAVQLNYVDASAWHNLGIIHDEQGDYDRAIKAYLEAIHVEPDSEILWRCLGTVYSKKEEYAQAISAFQKAIQLKDDNVTAWIKLGAIYCDNQGDYPQAIEIFQKVIHLEPDHWVAWYNLGVAYHKQGEYGRAIEAYQKAIQIVPNEEIAWFNLGCIYGEQGNYAQAIKAYQKVLEIKPTNNNATEYLEKALSERLQSQTSTEPELSDLETWLQGRADFEIITSYVNVYRRVVFDKEEKALYDLPKEQRIFFEREILKKIVE